MNIKTLEGRDAVKDMLGACLNKAKPRNWALEESETVSETDGVTEAWFTLETEFGRGSGYTIDIGASRTRCGCTAATCTSRATIRSSWRCN